MTVDRTVGLTPADVTEQQDHLGDDEPRKLHNRNLGHAFAAWTAATANGDRDAAGQLRWANTDGSTSHTLSNRQQDLLIRLLSVDTGLHLAHGAATRKD